MGRGRQKDYGPGRVYMRCLQYGLLFKKVSRVHTETGSATSARLLLEVAQEYEKNRKERECHKKKQDRRHATPFEEKLDDMTNLECLQTFSFEKKDLPRLEAVLSWRWKRTKRSRFSVNGMLVLCVILARYTSPRNWADYEDLFGKPGAHLSEIFWEGLEHLIQQRGHLITGDLDSAFIRNRAQTYAQAIFETSGNVALRKCIGFIDATVIGICRPKGRRVQRVFYNGHKKKHAVKFQILSGPDGLILHAYGPEVGSRNDWRMFVESGMPEQLEELLRFDDESYYVYTDSGYNRRWYLFNPCPRADLTESQRDCNRVMSGLRVSVEWVFKEVKKYFTLVDFPRKLRVHQAPVGTLYLGALLLTNFRNCIYPNEISQYFKVRPPTLEEYIAHKGNAAAQ